MANSNSNLSGLPVFLETSLDTRLAVWLSYDDTVASLKRKIEAEHLVSFPVIGDIVVRAVKICLQGRMFTVTDFVPVSSLHNVINETVFLYVEAVSANHEMNLRNERVGVELKVPIGGKIEDSMVIEPPHVDKEILADPHHDVAGASASVLDKREKKMCKKIKSSGDASMRSTEFRESKDEGFEGNFVQEEPGCTTLKQEKKVNIQINNPADSDFVNFCVEKRSGNGDKSEKEEAGKGEQPSTDSKDPGVVSGKKRKHTKSKAAIPEVSTQMLSQIENELCKEKASNSVLEKVNGEVGAADFIDHAGAAGKEISRKKRKKTKVSSSDMPDKVPAIGEDSEKAGDSLHKSDQIVEKLRDSWMPPKSGEAAEAGTLDCQLDKERPEPEISLPAEKDIRSHNQHGIQQADMADSKKESGKDTMIIKETAHVTGGDAGVSSLEKKKLKKKKAVFIAGFAHETAVNESGQEKGNDFMLEKEIFKDAVDAGLNKIAGYMTSGQEKKVNLQANNPADSNFVNFDVENPSANGDKSRIDESGKGEQPCIESGDPGVVFGEKKKRKKSKAAFPEVLTQEPSYRESEPCKENASNSVLGNKKSKIIATDFINNAEKDPEVVSIAKRRHKKTKAASSGGLSQKPSTEETVSCEGRESNLNPGKEISNGAENAVNSRGGDHVVASKAKRKPNKNNEPSTGVPPQEPLENGSFKERENNFILEKETHWEADNTHIIKNADDVALSAPKSTDLEDSLNIVSDILADLKKSFPVTSDGQIDTAPQMQPLANVAVDQQQSEPDLGKDILNKNKEVRSGKDILNKTESLQNTVKMVTGDSIIAHGEKNRLKTENATPIGGNEIESRENFGLVSSQKDDGRDQTLNSDKVEDSIGGKKEKKIRKHKARNSGAKVAINGATYEENGSFQNSLPQTNSSMKKDLQTKFQKSLKEDDVPADMPFVDKKSIKGKSKEKRVTVKHSDASVADGTNAPNTPEKVQKSGDYIGVEIRDKETSTEAVRTKGSEDFHAPATENINFMDYFSYKTADQPTDALSAPLKEVKGNGKTQSSFSKDNTSSSSVDTRVSAKKKKPIGKVQTTEKDVKTSKEHNPSETTNDKSGIRTSMDDDVSKKDDKMKSLLVDMAVMSDASTDDMKEARSQMRRPMVAVRKVASKAIGEKMNASRKTTAAFSSGSLYIDAAIDASARDESDSVTRGSPMPGKKKGRVTMSSSSSWKDEQLTNDDVPMSQESTRPKKKIDLCSVLRSSSSYKKAKISASQSQAEIDLVFETQPDLV